MLMIGIAGGSGSGKTTVVKKIVKSLPKDISIHHFPGCLLS